MNEAALALRRGELVVMPTETVYGLAGNALDPSAGAKIFALKGRPANNPLIVHTLDPLSVATDLCGGQSLLEKFWPGPLTLVLPKREHVPDAVTAGLTTVAVRMPDHPVALELLRESGLPLAAPSANKFTQISPTRAEDVSPEIRAGVFAVLDGGPCRVGIESTILSLVGKPTILRLGDISKSEIEEVLGREVAIRTQGEIAAPGMHPRHYAPSTPVTLVEELAGREGIALTGGPAEYAAQLYARLQALDLRGLDAIYVEMPPETPEWAAVRDRLIRAAHIE